MRAGAPDVAIIGGGWAGIAAAVESTRLGHAVTLYEMAPQLGGRSRSITHRGMTLDNGQHILIGAYVETLGLMHLLGVDADAALLRMPLRLSYPDGSGLQLAAGAALTAFAGAVLRNRAWTLRERGALLCVAAGWAMRRFRCDPSISVATLAAALPRAVRMELIEPLCVAALNTPAADASASVFLRVLKDALFSGPGSSDLLLPRVGLGDLVPGPAARWLLATGAQLRLSTRVERVESDGQHWRVDGRAHTHVLLACSAAEAARLAEPIAPAWAATAAALRYEPIVTVYLHSSGSSLPEPMLNLHSDNTAPAQFVFDRGRLGGPPGLLAFVISGARAWVDRGMAATLEATKQQARHALGAALKGPLEDVVVLTEKRATFRCTPGLRRPALRVAEGLHAAGDHVDGPYPATLEGAVRAGVAAVRAWR